MLMTQLDLVFSPFCSLYFFLRVSQFFPLQAYLFILVLGFYLIFLLFFFTFVFLFTLFIELSQLYFYIPIFCFSCTPHSVLPIA